MSTSSKWTYKNFLSQTGLAFLTFSQSFSLDLIGSHWFSVFLKWKIENENKIENGDTIPDAPVQPV